MTHPCFRATVVLCALLTAVPAGLRAQSADDIIRTATQLAADRTLNVENYTIRQRLGPGAGVPVYFERDTVEGRVFVLVPPHVVMRRHAKKMGCDMSSLEDLNMQTVMKKSGFGNALGRMTAPDQSDDPPVIVDPLAAADLLGRARLLGKEKVDGRETYVLVADDLRGLGFASQEMENGGFTIQKLTVYVDLDDYLTRQAVVEGELTQNGKRTPVRMVSDFTDYRRVETMIHPFRTSIRLEGLTTGMSDKDRRKLQDMKKQMAEAQKQLARLPEAQRKMFEAQFKGKMDELSQMAEGGAMQMSIEVESLLVNAGPPPEWAPEPVPGEKPPCDKRP